MTEYPTAEQREFIRVNIINLARQADVTPDDLFQRFRDALGLDLEEVVEGVAFYTEGIASSRPTVGLREPDEADVRFATALGLATALIWALYPKGMTKWGED